MEVLMPQIGMTMVEGTIENWIKKDGDVVAKEDELVEFFTEKMSSIIKAPADGVLKILSKEGEVVSCGEPVAEIN